MASPSKVKKLQKNRSKLWGYKHNNRNTKQAIIFNTDKYKITADKNKLIPIKKIKLIKSFGSYSYLSANYEQNKTEKSSLILLDENINKFFSNKKIEYITKGHQYKLKRDSEPTLMTSDYVVDGIPTSFSPSEIEDMKKTIIDYTKEYNQKKALDAMEEHENDSNDDIYQIPLLPENNTQDSSCYGIEEKADQVLQWKNNINDIKNIDPAIDWIKTQIKIFERNGTMKKDTFDEIDSIINKRLSEQKKKDKKLKLSYKYPNNKQANTNNIEMKDENSNNNLQNKSKIKIAKGVYVCICDLKFNTFKAMCIHNAWKRKQGDIVHLQSTHFCSFWDSPTCAPEYHHLPTKEAKNHHELHTHHNEIKKNQFAPNFEKKCYKCGESHTKWKISRSGILMGIRCNNCKFAYWIKKKYKYKRNELNEVEKNTIIAQFKSSEEMQQEYAGLRGEAPPSSHNNKSKVLDECPSNGIESLSFASNSNSNNEGNNKGNNKGNNEFSCQVCKLLIGINSYFETEQDLKAHISALHKK